MKTKQKSKNQGVDKRGVDVQVLKELWAALILHDEKSGSEDYGILKEGMFSKSSVGRLWGPESGRWQKAEQGRADSSGEQ